MKRTVSILLGIIMSLTLLPCCTQAEGLATFSDVDHVLIYNPLSYSDDAPNKLFSGTLPQTKSITTVPEPASFESYTAGLHQMGNAQNETPHKDGALETRQFWVCTNLTSGQYDQRTFTLLASGDHCSLWSDPTNSGAFSTSQAEEIVTQFENVIYPTDTASFGAFRDLAGDGKINIVTYQMSSNSVCGFFDTYDLYTAEEIAVIDPDDAAAYNSLPIVNINTTIKTDMQTVYCTVAHEFQHLIQMTAILESPANDGLLGKETRTGLWYNEGCAMQAEELCYAGSVAEQGYLTSFAASPRIKNGQSLCHFLTSSADIGAYGASFLFTEYLKGQTDDTVFAAYLTYWRTATENDSLTDAKALASILPDALKVALFEQFPFSEATEAALGSAAEQLLSRLNLAMRLALLTNEQSGLLSIGQTASFPLYTGTGDKIEGGGALVLAVADSAFSVPCDADAGLLFVGVKDGAIVGSYQVTAPESGFYVLTVTYDNETKALLQLPAQEGYLPLTAFDTAWITDGAVNVELVKSAVYQIAGDAQNGFTASYDTAAGTFYLGRVSPLSNQLSISETPSYLTWRRFDDGTARLQYDGLNDSAILYNSYLSKLGYYAPAYFSHASFARPTWVPVRLHLGDVDLDGAVTAADAALLLRGVAGLHYLNAVQRACADMTNDNSVTAVDATRILRRCIGLGNEA